VTTDELLRIVEQRGLKLALKEGSPVTCEGEDNPAVTDALLAVLKIYRERIISVLGRTSTNTT
jgi:hypothetical protein